MSSSPSTGTAGPSEPHDEGPPAPPPENGSSRVSRLPAPDLKLLLRLILALALALTTWYLTRYPYSHMVVGAGSRILSVMSGMPPEEIIEVRDGEFYLDTGLERRSGKSVEFLLPVYQVHWNSILFLSLLFITPWRLWRLRWKYLLAATLLLALSHVLFFTVTIFGRVAAAYAAAGLDIVGEGTITAIAFTVRIYSVIIEKAVPFLLFIPVVTAWRKSPEALDKVRGKRRFVEKVRRNAPCPCGSGKKYKNCCLR